MLYGWFDGGSRGNPGPAGGGWVIRDELDGPLIHSGNHFLDHTTNNVAEYTGLIDLLRAIYTLREMKYPGQLVEIRGDSNLIIKQLLGQNAVKSDRLRPLYEEARALYAMFDGGCRLYHVYREFNKDADAQANIAMDTGCPRGETKRPGKRPNTDAPLPNKRPKQPNPLFPKAEHVGPVTDGRAVAVRIRRENNHVTQDCDVYVGRQCNRGGWDLARSKWHNPISLRSCNNDAAECVRRYHAHLKGKPALLAALPELRGKRLGCWCESGAPCHARLLAALANDEQTHNLHDE